MTDAPLFKGWFRVIGDPSGRRTRAMQQEVDAYGAPTGSPTALTAGDVTGAGPVVTLIAGTIGALLG